MKKGEVKKMRTALALASRMMIDDADRQGENLTTSQMEFLKTVKKLGIELPVTSKRSLIPTDLLKDYLKALKENPYLEVEFDPVELTRQLEDWVLYDNFKTLDDIAEQAASTMWIQVLANVVEPNNFVVEIEKGKLCISFGLMELGECLMRVSLQKLFDYQLGEDREPEEKDDILKQLRDMSAKLDKKWLSRIKREKESEV